ncbi:hypothetical protein IV41_GL001485 [Limosilactobacillus ingluviei]|uniref:Uncharacterized protein n=1 Tax=Limosilactobacillus ingluviei TaxID=148604 RepID=A0A0R2H1Q0_9LACO|nr:hypothetical protein IV41_GL001485 [Limosilactobacillus ingluviei]
MIRRNFIQFSKVYQFVVSNQRLDDYIITFKLVSRTFFEEALFAEAQRQLLYITKNSNLCQQQF